MYASPGVIDAYRKDKRFPDGAVLVKEVFKAATSEMTTGTVSRADALKGWFVMVKDAREPSPGERAVGRRLGMVVVRRGRSLKNDDDELQGAMPGVPCARAGVRLGLRRWIPSVEAIAMVQVTESHSIYQSQSSKEREMAKEAMTSEMGMSKGQTGHLYMQTNEIENAIIHYTRQADGTLAEVERITTGGAGSGEFKPISGQESAPNAFEGAGSVIITPDRRFLFTTNGGDNSVSSFRVERRRPAHAAGRQADGKPGRGKERHGQIAGLSPPRAARSSCCTRSAPIISG